MFSAVRIKVVPFVLLLALVFAFLLNWPVLLHFYDILSNIEHFKIGFVVSIPFLLVAALNFVFMPFSIRFLMKPFFAFLFVTGSIASYTMMKYRVLFDGDMIQNIFETNQSEAFAYVNAPIIIWVILTGLLPAALIFFVKIEYASTWYKGIAQRLLSMFFSLVIVGIIAALYYQDYASIGRNNQTLNREIVPANFMYSTSKYLYRRYMAV
ncbi:DUF1705 domain-containing protein [Aeromonas caviae]|nr:DUF1705 domain-containing protein [Aeromonas caviae]